MPEPASNPTGPTPPPSARAWASRGPLIAYLVVVIAVLAAINVLASRHDKSWDLTKNHAYSLSPESVKIVQGLQQPLHLIYFDKSNNFGTARDLLGRYQRESNKVDAQYVDPDRHPDQARAYGIQNYGTVAVQSGDHKELVTSLTEQDLTNAMVRVLKGGKKSVYFAEGEGEPDPDDTGRGGFSDLKAALTAENFNVQKLVLAQSPTVPADCAVLIVAGPKNPMVAPEVQAISQYIDGGGHVLFLLGFDATGPLVNYVQNSLDVKLTPDVVVDTSGVGRLFGASELMPIAVHYDTHAITQEMNETATLFPYARTVEPGAVPGAKATVSPLVETSSQSLATTNFAGGNVRIDPATDRHGPFTLGVAGTIPTTLGSGPHAGDSAEARFVVYGSSEFPTNAILGFNGNKDLFLNTMNWLSTQENFISIRPQTPTNAPVNLTAAQMRFVFFGFLVGLPLAIVIIGVGVWWKRRAL